MTNENVGTLPVGLLRTINGKVRKPIDFLKLTGPQKGKFRCKGFRATLYVTEEATALKFLIGKAGHQ